MMDPMTWTASHVTRIDEPFVAAERAMLGGFLDWHRSTLLHKCSGLTGAQSAEQASPPPNLSLVGLVRHMADVERTWFRRRFGAKTVESLYARKDNPDAAFDDIDAARTEGDLACQVADGTPPGEPSPARRSIRSSSARWGRCPYGGPTAT